jgi:hypothetical protein
MVQLSALVDDWLRVNPAIPVERHARRLVEIGLKAKGK